MTDKTMQGNEMTANAASFPVAEKKAPSCEYLSFSEAIDFLVHTRHITHLQSLTFFEGLSTIGMDDALDKVSSMKKTYLEQKGFKPYQDTDGRWRGYVYQDVDGKRKRKAISAQTKKEVEKKAVVFYEGQEEKNTNFSALKNEFFAYRKRKTKSLNTVRKLQTDWTRFLEHDSLLEQDLSKLDYENFEDWFYSKLDTGIWSKKEKCILPYTTAQAKALRSLLNLMFHFAVYKKACSVNFSHMLGRVPYSKYCANNPKPDCDRVFQDNKETELVEAAYRRLQNKQSLANAGIMLDACLDLRVGELAALRFSDFEERPGFLHIQRMEVENTYEDEKGTIHRSGYVIAPHPKSEKSNRYILVSPAAKKILQMISDIHTAQGIKSEYLFVNSSGERLHTVSFHNLMRRRLNPDIKTSQKSIHAIRRTGLSIIREDIGGEESARHGGHDEQVNRTHYHYQVDTKLDDKKYEKFHAAIDKKMPDFLK